MTSINNTAQIQQNSGNEFSWKIDTSINKKVERLWLNSASGGISVAALAKNASPSWWQRTFTHYQIRHPYTKEKVWVNFRSYEKRVGSSQDALVQDFYKKSLSIDVYAKKVLNLKGGIPSITQGNEGGWDALERLSKSKKEVVRLSPSNTAGIAYNSRGAYLLCMDASRGDLIGEGSFKRVFKVINAYTKQDDEYVVARELHSDHNKSDWNEAVFTRSLDNPHCIEIVLAAKSGLYDFIVMPKGEPLPNQLGSLSFDKKVSVMRSLLEGLLRLHQKGFVHRDIKPQNILLLKNDTPRYIDFGISEKIERPRGRIPCLSGTPGYFSPEQQNIRHNYASYDLSNLNEKAELYANDVWALGMTAYKLFDKCDTGSKNCGNRLDNWLGSMLGERNHVRIRTAQAALDAFNLAFPPPPILP